MFANIVKVYKITLLKKKIFIIFATNFYQLKIIRDLSTYKSPDFTAVSIGMFDGVHLGHQSVISLLKEKAKEKNLKTALLSFWPHPRKILNPELEIEGVLLTMYDSRNNLSEDVKNETENYFKDKLFDTVIPRNIRLAEAPSFGESIIYYDKNSKGAIAYLSLAKELIKNRRK